MCSKTVVMDLSSNEVRANSRYYVGLDLEAKKRYDVKIVVFGNS